MQKCACRYAAKKSPERLTEWEARWPSAPSAALHGSLLMESVCSLTEHSLNSHCMADAVLGSRDRQASSLRDCKLRERQQDKDTKQQLVVQQH